MRKVRALIVVAAAVFPALLFAHARLDYPPPRSLSSGIKVGPCGTDPHTAPTVFSPGQQVDVTWIETIAHPGWYRIAFSPANDQGFDQNVLADMIPNDAGIQNGDDVVTLPTTPCEGCSLQLVMHMTDKVPPSDYFSCADIAIRVPDAGSSQDAGSAVDAGAAQDAGTAVDAGQSADAGGSGSPNDAGASETGDDAGTGSNMGPITTDIGCSETGAWEIIPISAIGVLYVLWKRQRRRRDD